MPAVGIEPTLDDKSNGILSPARLPVPPCRRKEMTGKWTLRDSNPGPIGYEPTALTN